MPRIPQRRLGSRSRVRPQGAAASPGTKTRPGSHGPLAKDPLWGPLLSGKRSLGTLHDLAPIARIGLVREGVPAAAVSVIAEDMSVARDRLYAMLGLARATIERKLRHGQRLGPDESERVIGIARLIGQVGQVVTESGDPAGFDAARWVAGWLSRPLPALGGRLPSAFLDTAEGREILAGLIAQTQSAAYA
jgi:putative toxin-antitoxin system antitoxin component (TIGR02293 family)